MYLVSKKKKWREQFEGEYIKTFESHKLSMRLFLCGIFSQAHWGCEASSESSSSPCGRLKLIFGDLKQPLALAQEAGEGGDVEGHWAAELNSHKTND